MKEINKQDIEKSNSWPIVEAKKILKERKSFIEKKGKIVLQTGYGPSGLPHIGTFGEVARTSMVVNALNLLTDLPKEIITFSDDMDGLRKVPDNVPNKKILTDNLHKPLTVVPDPFQKFSSFGEHNNEMLKKFLDQFNFKYNFLSSTKLYKSGFFNEPLKKILENYDGIMNIIIPTLGKERQKTYSPFLPICPKTGQVLEIPVLEIDKSKSCITFDNKGEKISKSKGNGVTIEEWLKYASPESLSLFMFQNPKRAKKLYKEIVPKAVDEYLDCIEKSKNQSNKEILLNPVWHVHNGNIPDEKKIMSYSMLLNLVETSNANSKDVLWKFVERYAKDLNKKDYPIFDKLIEYSITYFNDIAKSNKKYKNPNNDEKKALLNLIKMLENSPDNLEPEDIQTNIYTVGKENGYKENLRDWFKLIYEVVFGVENGPRLGFFISFFGVKNTIKLIKEKIN